LPRRTDVQRLIPGDVAHLDGDLALHVVGVHDVHLAHVGQQAEDVVDVRRLEVEVDAPAGVALARLQPRPRGGAGRRLRDGHRRQQRRQGGGGEGGEACGSTACARQGAGPSASSARAG
jgi:hypothetical protein